MAIRTWAGYPDLFITFTTNPRWLEIEYMLDLMPDGMKTRIEIIDRVFEIKLAELMHDIKHKHDSEKQLQVSS